MHKILVVEDESVIRAALRRLLERNGYEVREAGSVQEAQSSQDLEEFDLIISDLRLPGAPGTDLIRKAGEVPVLIMTSYASLRSAVDSMRMGAVDYIAKPFDHADMIAAVQRIIADHPAPRQVQEKIGASSQRKPNGVAGITGNCQAMLILCEHIRKVAPTDSTVLVLGETGTGKEIVARSVHRHSPRADRILVSVNCAAIPDTLIESELFGYEKGAFTGANASRMGLIEAADSGTLFLDEIGELPMEAQARLLRFIQEGEIRRIGSVHSRKVNVRLICATHRNLQSLAAEGLFRQDLFYRINVLQLSLPPLRERGKDILQLAENILQAQVERLGKPAMRLSPRAIQAITTYQWPGNVRELEHAIERAVILSDDEEIDSDALGIDLELVNINRIRGTQGLGPSARRPSSGNSDPVEDLSLEDYFQRFVMEHQDSMSETELAQKLGVSRKCLWERRQDLFYRINVLQLSLPPLRERGKDILQLAENILQAQVERLGKPAMRLSPRAIQAITTYQWPGNVRELEHAIERAVILSDDEEIDSDTLGIDLELVNINRIRGAQGIGPSARRHSSSNSDPVEDLSLEDYFQRFVMEHQDSMSETELAQKLGVSRKCLWERRQRLGIPRNRAGAANQGGKPAAREKRALPGRIDVT